MQSVAIRNVAPATVTIKWLKPAPLWGAADSDKTRPRPYLAEFQSDQFLPDFLAMMSGQTSLNLKPPQDMDAQGVFKLYQPLHQRYYLVAGSLVCRQFSLPDRTVVRKNHEQTSFVLRRILNGNEYGWVNDGPNKGWQPLVDEKNRPVTVRSDEERLPLHQVKACMPAQMSNTPCQQRMVYYGYIPVSSREKYLAATPSTDVATQIQQAVQVAINTTDPKAHPDPLLDPRLAEISSRVIEGWRMLYVDSEGKQYVDSEGKPLDPQKAPSDEQKREIELYLILDLGDCLNRYLPDVFAALGTDGSSLSGDRKTLFNELSSIFMTMTIHGDVNSSTEVTLARALYNLRDKLALAQGQGDLPGDDYQIDAAYQKPRIPITPSPYLDTPDTLPGRNEGTLFKLFRNALREEGVHITLPPEVAGMIKTEQNGADSYYVRLVYEHAPCVPVVSEASQPFTFAKVFDPDAPARPIRIEMPSIRPQDLRKYKRGVGLQMSPDLRRVMKRVHTGMLNGQGLLSEAVDVTTTITWICIFSIPIITLVALIVMFIFLILFNIIFWWLPFLLIWIPIPRTTTTTTTTTVLGSSSTGP